MKQDFGLIGLAVMGQNLALNMERNGFSVAVYNRTADRTRDLTKVSANHKRILPTYSIEEFLDSLNRPRKVLLMIKAGEPVDAMIRQLLPHMQSGDLIIDGGNSFFKDSERRAKQLLGRGLLYLGMGISGGEHGALWGPSLMPGGQREAYDMMEPLLTTIAAKADGEPCVTYVGPGGAGHYAKMIHNGIEYGDMQLISEAYDLLHRAAGLSAPELHRVFAEWNRGELSSYLIEITSDIFAKMDAETRKPLVEMILDTAEQKGTGKWVVESALELGVPIPTISAAVESRHLSNYKRQRVEASKMLSGPSIPYQGDREEFVKAVEAALYVSKICAYAQGMSLLQTASQKYHYSLHLGEIARIWRGGCIIRARLLDEVRLAFERDPRLPNLLLDPAFKTAVNGRQDAWRRVVRNAVALGLPCGAMSASLAYYDAYRSARLPANLIQAQRDYFGAHAYRRVDEDGVFHANWQEK
jgi:6-phosphogluconate dehydrogenase